MQVTSYFASASVDVLHSSRSVAPRDPAVLIAADLAFQRAEGRPVPMQQPEGGHGHDRHHQRDRSGDEGMRSHHRVNRLVGR